MTHYLIIQRVTVPNKGIPDIIIRQATVSNDCHQTSRPCLSLVVTFKFLLS